MSAATELYERDFYAWTQDQAALLRAWPEALRPNALDIANLAEEIESLGRSQRSAVASLLFQIILHLLKLRGHPDQSARRHWQKEVAGFRDQIARILEENPSLRAHRAEVAAGEWRRAHRLLRQDLELDGLDPRPILGWIEDPAAPFFDLDTEVLAEGWYPPAP